MNTLMMPAAAARFNHVIAFDVARPLCPFTFCLRAKASALKTMAPPSGAC